MLDVARHLHEVERVKRVIDQMAVYKLTPAGEAPQIKRVEAEIARPWSS